MKRDTARLLKAFCRFFVDGFLIVLMRKPDFFIVGAPKCGTTSMYHYLAQHPEVFLPEEKEVHYFGTDLILPGTRRDEQEYLAHFAAAQNEKRAGHSFNWYLFSSRAAAEIREFNPAAHIIIMLRNPVDMIYSLHSQRLYSGTEDTEDFREAIEADEERRRGLRMPNYTWITRGLFYLEVARYAEQVKRYVDVFGWEKIKLTIFEDFISNTPRTYKEVCESLGVDARFEPLVNVVNPNKRARSRVKERSGAQDRGTGGATGTSTAKQRQEGAAPRPQQREDVVPVERGNRTPGTSGQAPTGDEKSRSAGERQGQAPAPHVQSAPAPSAKAPALPPTAVPSKTSAAPPPQDEKKGEDMKK